MEAKGYLQVYTGEGKGKTTAALGLLLRAAGAGMKVFFGQFLKRAEYSEHKALARLPGLTAEAFGGERAVGSAPTEQDRVLAQKGVVRLLEAASGGEWDLVIADEIFVAVHLGLISKEDVLALAEARNPSVELVMTGRYAFPEILERADLVTEMKEIKHYFAKGIAARRGIEL
ncbi:MAG: cob(I)yrinic acid a,c-diamide adenosyltransferase [Synergistaceae bacterium]|nr:cob(I)yrinic acid a,c-diamide adenosyltransferase [Synergistaceae bacterium]